MANPKYQNLVLSSPAPINDCGRSLNWIYLICAIAGVLLGIPYGIKAVLVFAAIGCAAGWGIKDEICYIRMGRYRNTTFAAQACIPYKSLLSKLIPVLTSLGMSVEVDKAGQPSITFRGIIYDFSYLEDGKSFRLWWRLNLARAAFSIDYIGRYRKVSIAMGIIAYYSQQIIAGNPAPHIPTSQQSNPRVDQPINSSDNKSNIEIQQSSASPLPVQEPAQGPKQEMQRIEAIEQIQEYKFCRMCGTKLSKEASFCIKCGTKQ